MTRRFALSFDYLCPFARNAHEHVITALRDGADWDVTFVPYSLSQGHVPEGEPALWERDDPAAASGILAFLVALTVRDDDPDRFLDVHEALFATRHDHGRDIKDPAVLAEALDELGLDGADVVTGAQDGRALKTLQQEHEAAVADHDVWGVPTFIGADRAVFVRLLDRPDGDAALARRRVEQVLDLVEGEPALHEFKQTELSR